MAKNGTHFSESHFEKKLNNLKDTQESIQGLSAWCLNHKSDLHHIIKCWLKAVKKGKSEQCLTLFYLANDVIQHSKKKNLLDLVSAWEPSLKEATPYAREEKVRNRVQRIFKIWEERDVYSTSFVQELIVLLESPLNVEKVEAKPAIKLFSDFETNNLIEKIHQCRALEEDTDLKQRTLNESKVKITEVDNLRASVKERRKTEDFFTEFDTSVGRMEDYVRALEMETRERATLLNLLEQADLFYDSQRGEFKVVCTAYKQFGNRVKGVKRKLEEIMPNLPKTSVHSPSFDAPSPTSSTGSDLELPDAFVQSGRGIVPNRRPQESLLSQGSMDLDSRITSFLASGSHAVAGSFLTNPTKLENSTTLNSNPVLPPSSDPYPFYSGVNNSFGNLTSLLVVPPPPPPPPPPPLMPPPIFQDLPLPEPPPPPPRALLTQSIKICNQDSWPQSNSVHHSLPSRIPSWGAEEVASNGTNKISSHHASTFFPSQDVDLRCGKRPIDHRNLISLTSGPDNLHPTTEPHCSAETQICEEDISSLIKDVLKAKEARERTQKPADLNEQVINLLDSFDHGQNIIVSSRDGLISETSGTAKIKSLVDPHLRYSSHHIRIPASNVSFAGSSQTTKTEAPSKVPSLMATVLYPDRSSFSAVGSDNANRQQFEQRSPLSRSSSSSSATISSISPSNRGFSPARFSRPPYPRGSRW